MHFLITGTAGFIGFHLSRRLLREGHRVYGYDGMTPYYDVGLKRNRHKILADSDNFRAMEGMLTDAEKLASFAKEAEPEIIIHLAAQAGVRYSITNPDAYIDANLIGTFNVLEIAQRSRPTHLLLASTSSIYGGNTSVPYREIDRADHPLTLYASTKKATELMAHSYSNLMGVPTTILRFFTVYGPWGRPDMALFKFVQAILSDRPIEVYGEGRMTRDFTYVDDLVEAITRLIPCVPEVGASVSAEDSISPVAPYRAVNIAGSQPTGLLVFIEVIERVLGREARKQMMPMQAGDVPQTMASTVLLETLTGFKPRTSIEEGISQFVKWYLDYYSSERR